MGGCFADGMVFGTEETVWSIDRAGEPHKAESEENSS